MLCFTNAILKDKIDKIRFAYIKNTKFKLREKKLNLDKPCTTIKNESNYITETN